MHVAHGHRDIRRRHPVQQLINDETAEFTSAADTTIMIFSTVGGHLRTSCAQNESMTSSSPPLILVVSGDEVVRQQLVHDIAHRFGADYTVAAAATTDAALHRWVPRLRPEPLPRSSFSMSGSGTRRRPLSCAGYISWSLGRSGSY